MKKSYLLFYSVLTGILLSPAWYGIGIVLFIAFIPLLLVEDHLHNKKQSQTSFSAFKYSFLSFIVWNLIATWWIKNASFIGLIMAVLVSALLQATAFWLFHITRRKLGNKLGYLAFIIYWISYEFAYLHGEINWPWLNLGNGFMYNIKLIQWYDTTGIFGGSLWILIVNLFIFLIIKDYSEGRNRKELYSKLVFLLLVLIIPITVSLIKFKSYREDLNPRNIVVIQPNIDPYYEKFNGLSSFEQTMIQLDEARSLGDSSTDYFVAPETSIPGSIWIESINDNPNIKMIKCFIKDFPEAKYITGITAYKMFKPGEELTSTAKPYYNSNRFYEGYNSGIQVDTTDMIQLYHKSKLVIGVETMPYPELLKFLGKLALKLGGTSRGWGIQNERDVLVSLKDSIKVAPVICYESIFGEYVSEYIKKGANYIFVITNDGWWGDTPGYRQHNRISCIRAIETRRSIARSANTGISCFINQKGEILNMLPWWERGAIKNTINANDKITFYVKYGDYIARIAAFLAVILLAYTVFNKYINKKHQYLNRV